MVREINHKNARRWMSIAALVAGFSIAASAVPRVASAHVPPTPITKCQTISHTGFYQVTKNLSTSSGDCLDITAPNVILDTHEFSFTGSGSADVAIHVTGANALLEGTNTTITGFKTGIEDDASGVTGEDFNFVSDTTGVLIEGVSYSQFTNLNMSMGTYGVWVQGGTWVGVGDFDASNNTYGAVISYSTGTRLWNDASTQDTAAGIWLGCVPGTFGGACPMGKKGTNNKIYDNTITSGLDLGIAIDSTEFNDVLAENAAEGNALDMQNSGDPTCTQNLYFLNFTSSLGSADPSCMSVGP